MHFNPRSHERSDNPLSVLCSLAIIFQSTLPREERLNDLAVSSRYDISIHAPTRGATASLITVLYSSSISIHAPTRGATSIRQLMAIKLLFQSTLPREERRCCKELTIHFFGFQSTLPREERHCLFFTRVSTNYHFNPRSHERSDSNIAQKICLFLYNTDNKYIIR